MDIINFNLEELKKRSDGFAYYILGRSYDLEENGVNKDNNKAYKYYMKGFNINYPLCVYSIGISYQLGLGKALPIDKDKGQELLKKVYPKIITLSEDKNINKTERLYAKFVTGAYYYWGLGDIIQDDVTAFNIIKACADEGHIAAIYDLGYKFYHDGIGVPQDDRLSKKYLKIAQKAGLKRAIDKYREYGYEETERE